MRLYWLHKAAKGFVELEALAKQSGMSVFRHLVQGYSPDAPNTVWHVYEQLRPLMAGHITTLHLMTHLGFPVVKPDIWLTRIWLAMGVVENRPGSEKFSRSVVSAAQGIAVHYRQFAWNPESVIREIDLITIMLVGSPDKNFGIKQRMSEEHAKSFVADQMKKWSETRNGHFCAS